MKSVTFTEFRRNASGFLDLVEKGETLRVLRHGKVIARVVPASAGEVAPAWKQPGLRLVVPGAALAKAVVDDRRGLSGVW